MRIPFTWEEYKERILDRCSPEPMSGCWLWMKSVCKDGYGKFSINDKCIRAHRAAWILFRGPIPDELCVCHKCDNPACINPHHLFLGTNPENTADKIRKGRQPRGEKAWTYGKTFCRGELSGKALLTNSEAREVRDLRVYGIPTKEIAAIYGISKNTVQRIWRGQRYVCV